VLESSVTDPTGGRHGVAHGVKLFAHVREHTHQALDEQPRDPQVQNLYSMSK